MHLDDPTMPIDGGFPRPDWHAIAASIAERPEAERDALWCDRASRWVEATAESLSGGYTVSHSPNFLMLSAQRGRYVSLLLEFLERARRRILSSLAGVASDEGHGRNVVLVFDEQDDYYRYLSHYVADEGEFPLSGGVFLNDLYGHFAFPFLEMSSAESVAAHELTHACLRHLPLPAWVDEGIAVTIEHELTGAWPLSMDGRGLSVHRAFWNETTLQEFWSGASFARTDIGNELSYELARHCIGALAGDYDAFARFANTARREDGGEAAALEAFGTSLGELVERLLGSTGHAPRPAEWISP